jgi:hypothetical protein
MAYTMEDFKRDYIKEHFLELGPEAQRELLERLRPEQPLAGLSAEQIRQYLDRLTGSRPARAPKPRRKRK